MGAVIPEDQRRRALAEFEALGAEILRRRSRRRLYSYYPDEGPLRRELYRKHLEFFRAGAQYRERCAMAANRVGKTEGMGGYELTLHLTGRYPEWWDGWRADRPIKAWAAGKLKETTRDIIQAKLFGPVVTVRGLRTFEGTGLIPGDDIGPITWRQGVPNLADTVLVRHWNNKVPDGWSRVSLKSYEQGRGSFEGTEQDVIWLDEEPPLEIYGECLIRTTTTRGRVMTTYTPLDGITEVVQEFMPGLFSGPVPGAPGKYVVNAGWNDVPHIPEEDKSELLASTPKYLQKARSEGIPALGSGVIYPVADEDVKCKPFPIPEHWPRIAGMDFGWDHPTAVAWLAWDRETDAVYVYDVYRKAQEEVPIHASAIKSRGDWIPVAWPRDGMNDTAVGPQLAGQYRDEDVAMLNDFAQFEETGIESTEDRTSKVSVEAGLQEILTRMATGRLRVFETCQDWFEEKAIYRREKGKIVKKVDDLMDAMRYAVMMLRFAIVKPIPGQGRIDWAARKAGRVW